MTKLTNEKKRALAERLYINEGLTAKQIALDLDVSEKTLVDWKKGKAGEQSWEDRRAEMLSAPHKIKELLLGEIKRISQGDKPTEGKEALNADAIIKLAGAIEKIDKKVHVHMVITVLKEFDLFMTEVDPAMAVKFLPFHKMFIHHKAGE